MKALLIATVLVGATAFAAEPTTTTTAPATAPSAQTATAPVAKSAPGLKTAQASKPNFKEECKAEGKTSKKEVKACIKDKKKAAAAAKEAPAAQ